MDRWLRIRDSIANKERFYKHQVKDICKEDARDCMICARHLQEAFRQLLARSVLGSVFFVQAAIVQ